MELPILIFENVLFIQTKSLSGIKNSSVKTLISFDMTILNSKKLSKALYMYVFGRKKLMTIVQKTKYFS